MSSSSSRNFITVILVPHSSRAARSWHLDARIIAGLAVAFLALALHLLLLAWRAGAANEGLRRQVQRLSQYEEVSRRQERELQGLREQAREFQQQVSRLEEMERQARGALEGGEAGLSPGKSVPPGTTSGVGGRSAPVRVAGTPSRGSPVERSPLPARSGTVFPRIEGRPGIDTGSVEPATLFRSQARLVSAEMEIGLQRADGVANALAALVKIASLRQEMIRRLPLGWPLAGRIASGFGPRRSPFSGRREFHAAVDIAREQGTPVAATGSGTVAAATWKRGLGRTVILDHGYGHRTLYAHLQRILVKPGDTVKRGQTIGSVGSTGLSTGPHLHYEVQVNGRGADPLPYISWRPGAPLPPEARQTLETLLSGGAGRGGGKLSVPGEG